MINRYGIKTSWWIPRLRTAGFRVTVPRQTIFSVLSKTDKHMSAEDIYMAVHKAYPAIGLTTVYRTLDLLVQMGLVLKFDFGDGKARYELIRGQQEELHHHHLVCKGCGRIIDYTDFIGEETDLIEKVEKELSNKYDFKIDRHIIQFYGLCNECKDDKK